MSQEDAWMQFLIRFIILLVCSYIFHDHLEAQDNENSSKAYKENGSFRLWYSAPQNSSSILANLEEYKIQIYSTWLPSKDISTWNPKCDVYCITGVDNYSIGGRHSLNSLGEALVVKDGCRVLRRKITLNISNLESMISVIPHEMAHVVLASNLNVSEIPCWLDEGIAMSCEPEQRQNEYLSKVHKLFSEEDLKSKTLTLNSSSPNGADVNSYYIRAYALTLYIIETHGRSTVLKLAEACQKEGRAQAFNRILRVNDFDELDSIVKSHFIEKQKS